MKKLLAACLITFVSFSAFAASGGRTGYIDLSDKKMQLLSGTESTSRLIVYDAKFEGGNCSKNSSGSIFFSDFLAKEMYSMLLTAKASGKRVELIAKDCVAISDNTVPKITSIYLE